MKCNNCLMFSSLSTTNYLGELPTCLIVRKLILDSTTARTYSPNRCYKSYVKVFIKIPSTTEKLYFTNSYKHIINQSFMNYLLCVILFVNNYHFT